MPSYVRSGAALSVSSLKAATQMRSSVKSLADGGFMVVWQSSDPNADGSGYAVRAQRYNAQGVAVGTETLINNLTAGDQNWPRFATLSSGGYVVTWETRDSTQDGSGAAIKARIFDASGAPLGNEFRVNTHAAADQTQPDVIAFSDGGFLIAWNSSDPAQDGTFGAAKAQRFDSTGAPVGAEFLLNSVAFGHQLNIDLATLANGGFVATWQTNTGSGTQVKGQVYAADGTRIGSEFFASDGTGTHTSGRVTALQGGGFILIWNSGSSALAQVFDAAGIKVGARLSIPASNAEIAALANGTLLVTWSDLLGNIKAQVYDTAGQALGPQTTVHPGGSATGLASGQSVAVLANGNIVLSWDHLHSGSGDIDIRAQILRPNTGLDLGAPTRTASTAENGFWQLDVLAQIAPLDSPGMPITYSIVGGADASRFILTASGELRFNGASNYEAPTDSNGDNVYEVIVRASDGEFSDDQAISVSVTNVNESPDITSNGGNFSASVTVAENQNAVTTVTGTDPEGSTLTYSIVSGADRARFTINASTGVLSFLSAPNFEAPGDVGANNVYEVTVSVSDGTKSDSQSLSITVANVSETPIISGSQTNYFQDENQTAVATLSATDGDGDAVAWSIAGGADAALFAIDPATGALRFVTAPNFEAPADSGANNVYNVVVSASDGTLSATRALTIQIANREEGPVIVSGGGADSISVSFAENSGVVTTIVADDPDAYDYGFTFKIAGGADAAAFTIHAVTGQLLFKAGFGNFEAPADAGGDNVYDVIVSVSDGFEPADTQAVSVTVTDANDAPVITSNGGEFLANVFMAENLLAVTTVQATDADNSPLTYAIAGGADAALFAIDAQTGFLSFISAPDREAPGDSDANNSYYVHVSASDGVKSATQQLTVRISDSNEAPVIASNGGGSAAAISVAENGTAVTTVSAVDPEGTALSYTIAGGTDASRFAINSATGALSFVTAPDHEQPADSDGNNVYDVVVRASDGVLWDEQALAITVGNANEGVAITSGASATAEENGTAVMTVTAQDLDGDSVSFAISGGADSALFAVDAATGALSFLAAPNFEAPADSDGDNVYEVQVSASDGTLSDSKSILVTVTNQGEAIAFVSGGGGDEVAITVNENDAEVLSLLAVDPDGSTPQYSILGGADAASFYLDPVTHTLRFHSLTGVDVRPDFETPRDSDGDNVYEVIVGTTDGDTYDYQTISVTVANVYEGLGLGPSVSFSAQEGTGEIGAIAARREAGVSVVYSITGGADASLFSINPVTGAISWVDVPDFEGPRDSDGNNVYHLEVTADDGITSDSQIVTVTVGNVDEPVVILSYGGAGTVAVTSDEGELHVGWVDAADPEGATVAYAIVGGADSGRFTIDSSTGALSFASSAMPDFESPADSDADNVYEVTIEATAGGTSATQAFSITVADVNEALAITSYAGDFQVSLGIGENSRDVGVVTAEDPEGSAIVYSIVDGYDGASFTIDAETGALRFLTAPSYEAPDDLDGDNVYKVLVAATDGTFFDYQTISVQIGDVNERAAITSAAAVSVAENGTAVATVAASDPDGDALSYAIAGGADSAFFTIDAQTGALSFAQAPNFEAPADSDGDNVYDVIVSATDGALAVSQAVAVTVTNVSESVAITSGGGGGSAVVWTPENGTAVTVVAASDPDGGPVTYAITGGLDAALFTIDSSTGALAFVAAPDFESTRGAGGGNVFDVIVAASDGSSTDSQSLSVILENVVEGLFITSYGGAESVSVTLTEGYFSNYDVDTWDDVDVFAPIVYSISGADAAFFTIDSQGRFGFDYDAPPNFEGPADADGDNVYEVTVTASISTYSDSQAFSITVVNRDENVVFTSHDGEPMVDLTVAENSTAVTTVSAVDPEGEPVSYAITGGADAALFTIDSSTGVLAFVAAPDFENNTDAWGNNTYRVTVTATDGTFINSQFFFVTVGNVDERPAITSGGGGESVSVTVNENGLAVTTIAATDPEGNPLTYSIAAGADASRFTIDAQTGALSFVQAPNFEAPGDSGGDNVYDVVVSVTDGTLADSQAVAVTVANLAENVTITSNGGGAGASVTVAENSAAVTVVAAVDPDGGAVTYTIAGGADAARFTIDASTGALAFAAEPDFEAYQDADGDNVYEVIVAASDGSSTDSQSLAVTVGDIDEPIELLSYGGAAAVALTLMEGSGLTVATVQADDAEDWTITYAITGGADAALFQINPYTGVLAYNYGVYPDFEAPADAGGDNVYDVVVTARSSTSSAAQAFALTIADRNEGLWITSNGGGDATLTMDEGDREVTTVTAEDQDGDVPTYSIVGGADAALFAIDPVTGALTFIAAPDYEAPSSTSGLNVYLVEVGASDGEFLGTQRLRIEIGNVNERPAITFGGGGESAAATVSENGLTVTTLAADDVDDNPLTWSIVGGADASRFTIESWSGILSFAQAPNFEAPGDVGANNVYDVVVSVTDGLLTDSQAIAVTVANLAEIVAITSNGGGANGSITAAENGTAVTTVAASNPDGGGAVTYAIAGGADSARFTINASTGVLAFVAAPNYEAPADAGANNVYDVVVSATNGTTVDTQALAVTVSNVNEQMAIASNGGGASAAVSVTENSLAVTTVVGVDPDGAPVTYAIVNGGDSGLFTIDATTGVLTFRAAPNFEAPGDAGGDNVYDLVVMATDGHWSDTQAIAVTVGNVAEAPVITSGGGGASGAVSVVENSVAVTTVAATDPEGAAATYSIVGGADAARFTINAQTGVLQFVAAPDWEVPADSNQDNVYAVVVRASDGQLFDEQALSVTVTNTRDGNNVTGTSGGDTISATSTNVALRTSNEEDLVFGRDGHDTISGMAGDDELYGEAGNDVLIGGEGADKLLGGLGKDTFTYNAVSEATGSARDLIMDFSRSQTDKISLSAIDANSVLGGNQAFAFIGTSAFSNVAGQLRYETSGGMTTVFGDVNGDGVADLQIQLSGSIALIASDFVL